MSLLLLIILVSGVFLVGGVTPKMHNDTLDMKTTGTVQGVQSGGATGSSFAAPGTSNGSKKSLQMKQLILTTTTPTPKSTPEDNWSIVVATPTCQGNLAKTIVTNKGTKNGYIRLDISDTSGVFSRVDTGVFLPVEHKMTLTLSNSAGFNTTKWKLSLFEGGTELDSQWNGGTLRKELVQEATGC